MIVLTQNILLNPQLKSCDLNNQIKNKVNYKIFF